MAPDAQRAVPVPPRPLDAIDGLAGRGRHFDLQLDRITRSERRPADERTVIEGEQRADTAAILVHVDEAALRSGDENVVARLELVGAGDGVEARRWQ
jgi:hypothetical protein